MEKKRKYWRIVLDLSKIENKVKSSKPFMYAIANMNPILEYIYNHPNQTKIIIGISYEQLIKLIENAQKIEAEVRYKKAVCEKRLIVSIQRSAVSYELYYL
ncbi:MAG: hypothetical protein F6K24_11735 [Okeania sp. SIO2D1]|nr:hypothetical protein [Okeania sp. SIO2D1]